MVMPTLFDILFYVFGIVTIFGALAAALLKNIVHAAFALLFAFFGVAGVYVMLSADFLAVSQIMVYVGGILILLVFGVMLTNRVTNIELQNSPKHKIPALILCAVLLFGLITILYQAKWITYKDKPWNATVWNSNAIDRVTLPLQGTIRETLDNTGSQGTSTELGKLLMTDFVLPFELVSIVLLVALIGAAMLARQDNLRLHTAKGETE